MLFSDTGGGHRAAAQAIDGALHTLDPDVRVEWCDPLIGQGRLLARRISSLYPTIITRAPASWGAMFHTSNIAASFATIRVLLYTQLAPVLRRCLASEPDVVLSVHPLLNHVTADVLRHGRPPRALMTVVTDLIDMHRGWTTRRADLIVVPTQEAWQAALRRHIAPERLRLYGLPVDLRFRPPEPGERRRLRLRLGLDEERPTALVAGGGDGSGGLLGRVRMLAEAPHPWQLIVVCGRNESLRRRLLALRLETPTLVLGFVDDMPDLMRAADAVIGKAGPGMIAEAQATGLPIVMTSFLPGQERGNVGYVTAAGAGVYAPRPTLLMAAAERLLGEDRTACREMSARALALSRPHATLDIAAACLQLASTYRAAAQASR